MPDIRQDTAYRCVSIRSRRLSAGECPEPRALAPCPCFNPLPPTVGGRMSIVSFIVSDPAFQSAPADCRRENRQGIAIAQGDRRFNPLPPTVGGRPRPSGPGGGILFQSAPADCRRENPTGRLHRPHGRVSIRSRRLSAENAAVWSNSAARFVFQSAPADCRRENAARSRGLTTGRRFNPLPPTVGGRILVALASLAPRHVSIRSRRLSAGESSCRRPRTPSRSAFQSAPADCRRENGATTSRTDWRVSRFNPLPPTVGGRIAGHCRCPKVIVVSIRSRRLSAGEFAEIQAVDDAGGVSIRSRRLSAGECGSPPAGRLAVLVSIRSRRLSAGE